MSSVEPMRLSGAAVDLAPRVFRTATVAASPTDNTEVAVASLSISRTMPLGLGILLFGFGAFTVGTNGVSVNLKLRRTDVSGTTLKATGAVTFTAADLGSLSVCTLDTSPTLPGQVYVLSAVVASASAASTFSAVELVAVLI